jgi:hypothetical protein
MPDSDNDLSPGVFLFKIPESFSCLAQSVTSIDHRNDFSGLKEFFHLKNSADTPPLAAREEALPPFDRNFGTMRA